MRGLLLRVNIDEASGFSFVFPTDVILLLILNKYSCSDVVMTAEYLCDGYCILTGQNINMAAILVYMFNMKIIW